MINKTMNQIKSKILAGDTLDIDVNFSDYPPATHTLELVFSAAVKISINSVVVDDKHHFHVDAATTATWPDAIYNYVIIATDIATALIETTLETGQTTIKLRADLETVGDKRTHYQIVLDNIEAVIEKRATTDQLSYSIAGRSISKMSIAELLQLRDYYVDKINTLKRTTLFKRTLFRF